LATEYIHSLIKKEIDSGVNAQNIVVGGFSMGGALAIYSSLTYPEELLGGVVGLSAFLLQRDAVQSQCTANKLIPIFLGHGRNDPIVQCIYGRLTAQKIKQWNPNVVFKVSIQNSVLFFYF
jgi:predicted esterase